MDETLLKLLLAVVVGGLIGAEREFRTGMGLRTLMLICLGATLFTIFSSIFSFGEGDPRRIAAAVVTGVGFLGAGMILRHQGGVLGLTTAATAWLVAALGMGIGLGEYRMIVVATLLVMAVLWAIPLLQRLTNARQTLTYEVLGQVEEKKYQALHDIFSAYKLKITKSTISKEKTGIRYFWRAYGRPDDHTAAMVAFLAEEDVQEFRVL